MALLDEPFADGADGFDRDMHEDRQRDDENQTPGD
jgi:hypothetical protein